MARMRTFLQKKLWRDKAVARLEAHGSRCEYRILTDAEYDLELRRKLLEEAAEVITANKSTELTMELADVLEVVDALCALHKIDPTELREIQRKKRDERGGFDAHIYVERAYHPVGGFGEAYCLADPEKYPEIIE